jgi:hypothetical protein
LADYPELVGYLLLWSQYYHFDPVASAKTTHFLQL